MNKLFRRRGDGLPFGWRGNSGVVRQLGEVNHPCWGGAKATRTEVERREACLEVHMHPFAASTARVLNRTANKLSGDPASLVVGPDLRVDEECVAASVPGHVDKSDRSLVGEVGCNPSKTVGADSVPPTSL